MKHNTDEVIQKAKLIYGNKYDYSKLEYINYEKKFKIICPIHGKFEKKYNAFLIRKQGCPKCSQKNKGKSINQEKFEEKINYIYNYKYNLSKAIYISSKTPVKIICPIHGEFERTPRVLMQGYGCKKCKDFISEARKSREERMLEKIKNTGLNIISFDKNNVEILCKKCNKIYSKRIYRANLEGCPYCNKKYKKTTESFIKEAKELYRDKFTYNNTKYTGINNITIFTCQQHGDFTATPKNFLNGRSGCPICSRSFGEYRIDTFLKNKNINFIPQKIFPDLKDVNYLSYDFYIPKYNLLIEYNGEQHYRPIDYFGGEKHFKIQKKHDKLKEEYARQNDIKLLVISYKETNNIDKILTNTFDNLNYMV